MRLGGYIAMVIAILCVPYGLDEASCRLGPERSGRILTALSDKNRATIIDFVLQDKEGLFRRPCHKTKVLEYIESNLADGQSITFNRREIIPYVGLDMERTYDVTYHEYIRYLAIRIAGRLFDDGLMKETSLFYSPGRCVMA
jgi:hypothetical protein